MRIIEIFHSLQGEGLSTGERTSFIRTARCNLRCRWCDTPYSFGPGVERSLKSILEEVKGHRTRHACLTGGEPLLQTESVELARALGELGYTTVVETGGSLDISPYVVLPSVHVSLDVKLPSSGMEDQMREENWALLRPTDSVKMVLQDRTDYEAARRLLARQSFPCPVIFQPVWGSPAGVLADWVLEDRLDVRLMLQEHKVLWGDVPGR
jgi:7-carboxy-7-deazaguanine synthase